MRELALITLRIVDENSRLYEDQLDNYFYSGTLGRACPAIDYMDRIEKPADTTGTDAVTQTSEGEQFRPKGEAAIISIEPCNPDSTLGFLISGDPLAFIDRLIVRLENAGLKALDAENSGRTELDSMSKTLGGEGIESTDMIQFYAVFDMRQKEDDVQITLEGVLRLDKIDMAIDEAILL